MKATASITMSVTLLDRLRQTARLEKRSLSQQLEMLAERHFAPAARRPRPPLTAAAAQASGARRRAKAERSPA